MQTLIAPCAGLSSRYGSGKPKYLYTAPSGKPLCFFALESLLKLHKRVIFIILRLHEEQYNSSNIIKQCFQDNNYPEPEILILNDLLNGPAYTVNHAINNLNITGPITIKDCDAICESKNYPIGKNAVSYLDASKHNIERLAAKSSLEVDEHNKILSIKEKIIFSKYICVGTYFFENSKLFKAEFEKLKLIDANKEIFISHIVESLLLSSETFIPHEVINLIDLGTVEDYYDYIKKNQTIFCDLDGVLFKNRGRYGSSRWEHEPCPITENINQIKKLVLNGADLIITTSRPEQFRVITEKQLKLFGINYFQLIMGLNHSPRVLINDYARSNPYPSATAVNVERNLSIIPFFEN